VSWVYIKWEDGGFKVGYFDPQGDFCSKFHEFLETEAARRCNWLNGGDGYAFPSREEKRPPRIA